MHATWYMETYMLYKKACGKKTRCLAKQKKCVWASSCALACLYSYWQAPGTQPACLREKTRRRVKGEACRALQLQHGWSCSSPGGETNQPKDPARLLNLHASDCIQGTPPVLTGSSIHRG